MSEKIQYVMSGIFSYSGKIIPVISGLIYTFLIANYLGPEKYGLVNYYISFTFGLIGIVGIYYFGGIVGVFMPKWKSRRFFNYCLAGVSLVSFLLFLILYVFSGNIVIYLGKSDYELFRLTSVLLLILPFTLFYTWVFRSFKFFGKELKFNLIVAVANLSLAFVLVVVLNYGVYGVVYSLAVANLFGLVFLVLKSRDLKFCGDIVDFSALRTYSKSGIPATFLNRVRSQVILVFMGLFIANEEIGMYYIAQKVCSVLLRTPVNSLNEILLPYISGDSSDKRKISRYVSLSIKFSLIVTIILSFFIILFSKYLLMILFPNYVGSYPFVVFLVFLFVASALTPLNSLFFSMNRMDVIAKSYLGSLVVTVVFGYILMSEYGVYGLIGTQILSALVCSFVMVRSLKSVGLKVEIIPRRHDFVYFWDSLNKLLLAVFSRMRR